MALAANRAEAPLCTRDSALGVPRQCVGEATTPLVSRAVRRARAGDRDALQFLYARYSDDVYDYARTVVSGHDEARDVTRRAFARLERLIDRYEERDAPFGAWIRRVARGVHG